MSSRARDYQPGEQVPGTVYEIVRRIGAGGMGTVYDVEDTTIGKRYVLKTLHPQLGARDDLARRMQNEARTLARLHHTNIVDVITAGVTSDELRLPYYVMERLNGQSLRMVLEKRGQLDLAHAYHIAIDLLDALDHAHDKGVIHRDVKPDNIFLHRTSAGMTVTKLLDFGILSLLDATKHETAGRFLGTLRYAAPEQLRGERPTPKVDVYAAALVLYEIVAGRGPFDDLGDQHSIAAAHMNKVAPPLSTFVVVPRELDRLVSASLAKLPDQRPRDAFSLAASLRNLKKALAGTNRQDTTENRATQSALLEGDAAGAPFVHVQQPSPDAPYIISPAGPEMPLGSTQPVPALHTTQRGMPAPTVGPPLAEPLAPTATSPPLVDREAPTNSFVPDVLPAPQQDTALPGPGHLVAPTLPSGPPVAPGAVSFQWPAEQPVSPSEEPHMRTLSGVLPGPSQSIVPVVAAVLLIGVLGLVSVALLLVRMRAPSLGSTATAPTATVVTTAPPLPVPEPVVVLPAPTLALPALEDPAPPSASAPVVGPTASPSRAPRSKVPAAATPTSTAKPSAATVTPALPTRPGPGF